MRFWIIVVCMLWSMTWYSLGEYTSKLWALKPSWLMLITVMLVYNIGCCAWLIALRQHGNLAIMTCLWSCATLLTGLGVGLFVFGEPITARQYIGAALALVAVALLS